MAGHVMTPLLLSLILFLSVQHSQSEISSSNIVLDARSVILFKTFGFSTTGHIEMNVSTVKVFTSDVDNKTVDRHRMGFFLTTADQEIKLQLDLQQGFCVLDDPSIVSLFSLQDVAETSHGTPPLFEFHYTVPVAKEFSLFFANCQRHAAVSMAVSLSLFNLDPGGARDYLPAGSTELPLIYLSFFFAYLAALSAWIYICYKRKEYVQNIHWLMAVLVLLKAFTLATQAGEYSYIKATGVPHGWNVAYYIFTFFRGIMLFTVIVLIGTGWSFLKPFLQDREKKVIMIVIPLQVLANLATIILDETGPSSREWFTWRDIFHLVDIICCCAILFPIVWSIKQLREASHSDGKAARTLIKLTLFRQFYVMVVGYIYFTRIIVYLLKSTTPYHSAWTADLAAEVVTIGFYIVTGYLFRPVEHNPYLHLDDDEEEAAAQALRDEDFEL